MSWVTPGGEDSGKRGAVMSRGVEGGEQKASRELKSHPLANAVVLHPAVPPNHGGGGAVSEMQTPGPYLPPPPPHPPHESNAWPKVRPAQARTVFRPEEGSWR